MDEITRLKQALTLEPLLDAAFAEAATGAKEFRDTKFLPQLEKTLEVPQRLAMSARGLMGVQANFTRFLVNRLRWEADVEKHPEILDEDVSDPIIVLGLPRSGTTKLQRFLSADPAPARHAHLGHVQPGPISRRSVRRIASAPRMGGGSNGRGDQHRR